LKIAIVTINLNNAAGLRRTLQSVAMQSQLPAAHVVVDGGSADESLEVIKANQSKITAWISEADDGVYQAQNKGWRMVNADYYLFLNSGDALLATDSLALLARSITHKKQLVYGNLMVENPDGSTWVKTYPDKLPGNYFDYDTLPHPATLISRYWLERMNGFDESLRICSDWKFFWQVFQKSPCSFAHVQESISCFDTKGISSQESSQQLINREKNWVRSKMAVSSLRVWIKKLVTW
jgi:glycosyltransferase involved in cell wall biosynthesis